MAGKPATAAMPSNKVDMPEPFSPTKNDTGARKSISGKRWMIGRLKGKASASGVLLRPMRCRCSAHFQTNAFQQLGFGIAQFVLLLLTIGRYFLVNHD